MQWLINILSELFSDRHRYFDRGDPAAYDFETGDFIKDSMWYDLDLSGIVPSTAVCVLMSVKIRRNAIGKFFDLRLNGNANNIAVTEIVTQVANLTIRQDALCSIGSDGLIEYRAQAGVWLEIFIVVKGWWVS